MRAILTIGIETEDYDAMCVIAGWDAAMREQGDVDVAGNNSMRLGRVLDDCMTADIIELEVVDREELPVQ